MRSSLILVVGCVVVLAGAFLASRMLVSDVPSGQPGVVTAPRVDVLTPTTLTPLVEPVPVAHPSSSNREASEAAMMARQGPLTPVNKSPPVPHAVEVADVAPSPFQGDSKELDYAEAIAKDLEADKEKLQSAHDVLMRCLEQEPGNKRCENVLFAVNARLFPSTTSELKPRPPTLQVEPPNQRRPVSQPR